MQAEISSLTLNDTVYQLRETVVVDVDEKKNHYGMFVVSSKDYNILGLGKTMTEAIDAAAKELANFYHVYSNVPEQEMSSEAVVFKNKLKNLVDA